VASTLEMRLRERHVYGAAVAAFDRDGLCFAGGAGYADIQRGEPATVETVFRVASVSKLLTATLALTLAARAALDLDAAVNLPPAELQITDDEGSDRRHPPTCSPTPQPALWGTGCSSHLAAGQRRQGARHRAITAAGPYGGERSCARTRRSTAGVGDPWDDRSKCVTHPRPRSPGWPLAFGTVPQPGPGSLVPPRPALPTGAMRLVATPMVASPPAWST
jgi:hypothetical protein